MKFEIFNECIFFSLFEDDEIFRRWKKKGKRKEDISSTKTDLSVCVSYKSIVVVLFFATNIFSAHRKKKDNKKKKKKKKNVLYKMNKKVKKTYYRKNKKKTQEIN
jgi:K+-sensing histidine kinase KdpD